MTDRDKSTDVDAANGHAGLRPGARVVVTGCAGFLGSHLSERLVASGHDVVGVDCFTDYYSRAIKEENLERLRDEPRFTFCEVDLSARGSANGLLEGADTVIHLAAQAGVRGSFGDGFATYLRHNVSATQALLEEAVRDPVSSFTYASSSSVYGNAPSYPTREESPRRPVSPYGMTKVATEELAAVYHRTYGVPVVGLRYFTAYGPRQRPDMAFTRFLTRAVRGRPLPVIGDGRQIRDFTYVDDVVDGTIAAASLGRAGRVYNIGGGRPVELRQAIGMIEQLVGRPIELQRRPAQVGEAQATGCDGSRARRELGYSPRSSLERGLAAQLEWVLSVRRSAALVPVA
jgi:nucleoside-diphosphate-sugar epimerase